MNFCTCRAFSRSSRTPPRPRHQVVVGHLAVPPERRPAGAVVRLDVPQPLVQPGAHGARRRRQVDAEVCAFGPDAPPAAGRNVAGRPLQHRRGPSAPAAVGRIDASIIMSNKPWDMAAGAIIAREAGALVLDGAGAPHSFSSRATVTTSPTIAPEL